MTPLKIIVVILAIVPSNSTFKSEVWEWMWSQELFLDVLKEKSAIVYLWEKKTLAQFLWIILKGSLCCRNYFVFQLPKQSTYYFLCYRAAGNLCAEINGGDMQLHIVGACPAPSSVLGWGLAGAKEEAHQPVGEVREFPIWMPTPLSLSCGPTGDPLPANPFFRLRLTGCFRARWESLAPAWLAFSCFVCLFCFASSSLLRLLGLHSEVEQHGHFSKKHAGFSLVSILRQHHMLLTQPSEERHLQVEIWQFLSDARRKFSEALNSQTLTTFAFPGSSPNFAELELERSERAMLLRTAELLRQDSSKRSDFPTP